MLRTTLLLLFLPTALLADGPKCYGEPKTLPVCNEVLEPLTGFVAMWGYKPIGAIGRSNPNGSLYVEVALGPLEGGDDSNRVEILHEISTEMCTVVPGKNVRVYTSISTDQDVFFSNRCE